MNSSPTDFKTPHIKILLIQAQNNGTQRINYSKLVLSESRTD